VVLGPRHGEDVAVLDIEGGYYLLAKTDPITFATDEIGWYAVNVNANDIATAGGTPSWFMATLLLPEGKTDRALVETTFHQIGTACDDLNVTLIGGHSEITYGINRPIIVGTMLGLVKKEKLVVTGGARSGDVLILTKGIPVEATAIIARERAAELEDRFSADFLARCANYLHEPGISVVRDALVVASSGRVNAMHDPTEGGLATGLWELAEASQKRLVVTPSEAVLPDGRVLCDAMGLDPLGAIASGALLLSAEAADGPAILTALEYEGIRSYQIGIVEDGPAEVVAGHLGEPRLLPRPIRDEIARLFE
jgi:hydrogenase maturation factor